MQFTEQGMDVDDTRKKRDSDQVGSPASSAKEKLKKLKGASRTHHVQQEEPNHDYDSNLPLAESQANEKSSGSISTTSSKSSSRTTDAWDLESALHRITRIGTIKSEGDEEQPPREYLSNDKKSWVKFRVGHAGDASTIAASYRRMKASSSSEQKVDDSALEMWLADGLGDEDTPPAVFALLAEVHTKENPPVLGSVVLLTQTWQDGKRFIKVEWHYACSVLLERRLWLRLSSLGLILSSELIVRGTTTREKHADCGDLNEVAGGTICEG